MPTKIMWSDMEPNYFPSFYNNEPGGSICQRENPGIGFDLFLLDIPSESVSNLLWQEHGFSLFPTLRISNDGLPIFEIHWSELQDFSDTHATTSHQFQHQSVSLVSSSEN
ncbi:MAG: hypothetical protein MI923_21270, partial [Phycisphaerales bacterium]|nr:hypothetical protein [Phycisphaerales bacterium]